MNSGVADDFFATLLTCNIRLEFEKPDYLEDGNKNSVDLFNTRWKGERCTIVKVPAELVVAYLDRKRNEDSTVYTFMNHKEEVMGFITWKKAPPRQLSVADKNGNVKYTVTPKNWEYGRTSGPVDMVLLGKYYPAAQVLHFMEYSYVAVQVLDFKSMRKELNLLQKAFVLSVTETYYIKPGVINAY